ncbi:MAG: GNAT family N-acetyltransferase [Anaerolineae bacterium]|nr:GNAT family N-acetyltransferase [Anaerolineae bacterium]
MGQVYTGGQNVMVVTAATEATAQRQGGLRRLDPVRDLGEVADLITDAFAQDMDERGRAALREMRLMGRLSPLVWWLSQADPTFQDTFSGFVWEEAISHKRQIVGNVNLNRAPGSRSRYIICNVVVAQEYRNQGIGRRLTERAIDQARANGAQAAVLQVRHDNPPARHLYTGLGFEKVGGEIDLVADQVRSIVISDAPGYRVRAWRPADGRATYQLAQQVIPEPQQWFRPIQRVQYWPDWGNRLVDWLGNLIGGQQIQRLVILNGQELVGMVKIIIARRQQGHRLAMLVHPEHAGQVEAALISRALHKLAGAPPQPVQVTAYQRETELQRILRTYGFEEMRTLLTLQKRF